MENRSHNPLVADSKTPSGVQSNLATHSSCMEETSLTQNKTFAAWLVLLCLGFSSCYEGGSRSDAAADETGEDAETQEDLALMACSETSFPIAGTACSLEDHEANIACRTCNCNSGCCFTCLCAADLHWDCVDLCQDNFHDGGTGCDLGIPPRCLFHCPP